MKNEGSALIPLHKRYIYALLVLMLGCFACGSAFAASFGVIANTNTLNLRAQGSSSSEWLGTYAAGTWVEIRGSQNNFYAVRTPDGKSGFMSKNFIDTTGDYGGLMRIAKVTNQGGGAFLNFRSQPSTNAPVLGIFYYGVPLLVLNEQYGWDYVEINGRTGYVDNAFVTHMDIPGSATVATIKTPGNTAMNLREGPGSHYNVVCQFSGDSYVMVLAKGSGWWRVAVDGYTGFMSKDYLVEGLYSAKDIAASGGETGTGYAVVANPRSTQALNLRAYPSTGAAVLEKLYNGTKLWVDQQGTEWSAVTEQQSGVSGYVMTKFIKLHHLPKTPMRRVTHPGGKYVNLRSSPDMEYGSVLIRVPTGKSVTIMIPNSDWCKVKYNGYTGYMLTYFLQ
ncbi:MAG: SH3 domain-containing protein [Clostridia bacterium]